MSKTTQCDHTERWLVTLLVLVGVGFSLFIPQVFWSAANFQSIASQIPVAGGINSGNGDYYANRWH